MRVVRLAPLALVLMVVSCSSPLEPTPTDSRTPSASPSPATTPPSLPSPTPSVTETEVVPPEEGGTHEFVVTEHGTFDEPWAMTFLPGTETLAITERPGRIKLRDASGDVREVSGVPDVVDRGQGGLADLIPGPTFLADGAVYVSWVEADGSGETGGVVGKATLDVDAAALTNLERIWEQTPKLSGNGHFSLRLLIDGEHLFVSSGERQEMDPAQDPSSNLGAIVRLTLDGEPAPDNPFGSAPVTDQLYTMGHRNPLGLALDAEGRLWSSEMGPQGGDELNLILPGRNYGWPEASNGSHYGGGEIPDHEEGDGFEAPKAFWNPSVSPGSLMIYSGELFPNWRGDAFLGALSGEALIRVDLDSEDAVDEEIWPMDNRIRAVAQAPDGAIWLLEDGSDARLLELRPE
ncbi:PQQ-dependent sugar dehydrogenase [Tessaracoccus caeni]|uniref:PQQ-dependent sugar dehydrogenase n=1 Tax=Tessaracoccus caeni TaxID=3031239 RepID=UPI0023DBA5C9|nr:PQQ-dependent sugar dehydrogenase [Tessaracoccus caeni]MDF1486994.1 PQQ-dependent sugar dehydrogenase [Tessaracoccus caeni]